MRRSIRTRKSEFELRLLERRLPVSKMSYVAVDLKVLYVEVLHLVEPSVWLRNLDAEGSDDESSGGV